MLNTAETQLVTVSTRATRYRASSSNYRRISASLFEMRSLPVDESTLCQMVCAPPTHPHFIRPRDAGGSDKGRISYGGLAGCAGAVVAGRRVSIPRKAPILLGLGRDGWAQGNSARASLTDGKRPEPLFD